MFARPAAVRLGPSTLLSLAATLDARVVTIEAEAQQLVQEASRIVLRSYGRSIDVGYKDGKGADPVIKVDLAVEAYLAEAVAARFPSHAVLGEESELARCTPVCAEAVTEHNEPFHPSDGRQRPGQAAAIDEACPLRIR